MLFVRAAILLLRVEHELCSSARLYWYTTVNIKVLHFYTRAPAAHRYWFQCGVPKICALPSAFLMIFVVVRYAKSTGDFFSENRWSFGKIKCKSRVAHFSGYRSTFGM